MGKIYGQLKKSLFIPVNLPGFCDVNNNAKINHFEAFNFLNVTYKLF